MKVKITVHIRRRIMANAWRMFKTSSTTFAMALRVAWRNMKYHILSLALEGRNTGDLYKPNGEPEVDFGPLPVPAGYYGVSGRYYGD